MYFLWTAQHLGKFLALAQKVRSVHGPERPGVPLRPVDRAQRLQVLPCPAGAPLDGFHTLALGGGQRLLGQKVCISGDDGEWRFEVVGQRRRLLGPLLLQRPAGPQTVLQRLVQPGHGGEHRVKLPNPCAGKLWPIQFLPGNGVAGSGQPVHLPGQKAGKPTGDGGAPPDQQYHQHQKPASLEVRQPAQRRIGIGHGVVILQQAGPAVWQVAAHIVLTIQHPGTGLIPPLGTGGRQMAVVHVGYHAAVGVPAGKHQIPTKGTVGFGFKDTRLEGILGLHGGMSGGIGAQNHAVSHQKRQGAPPEKHHDGALHRGGCQIPHQNAAQALQPGRRF
ncbi:MAG: hypothetical protein PUE19_03250 [bacterium]|nr:hypothetical protein [bacterium]